MARTLENLVVGTAIGLLLAACGGNGGAGADAGIVLAGDASVAPPPADAGGSGGGALDAGSTPDTALPTDAGSPDTKACRFRAEEIKPPDMEILYPVAVNESDAVLLQARNRAGLLEPVLRRADGTYVRLGVPAGLTGRRALGLNDLEQVVGEDSGEATFGYVWSEGTTYRMETPDLAALDPACAEGPVPEQVNASVRAINNRGVAVGSVFPTCGGGSLAMTWSDGRPAPLDRPSKTTEAWAISENGSILGLFFSDELREVTPGSWKSSRGAVLWSAVGYETMVRDDADVEGVDLNERGDRALWVSPYDDPDWLFGATHSEIRLAGGGTLELAPLPSLPKVTVSAINDHGEAVGSSWVRDSLTGYTRRRAVLWRDGAPLDLSLALEGNGVPELVTAVDLNNRGHILVGTPGHKVFLLRPQGDCFER